MQLYFNLKKAKAQKTIDRGNIFNPADFYFTYSVSVEKNQSETMLVRGFSRGCEIGHGYEMRSGQQRDFNDPQFIVELPELKKGEEKHVVIDLYCWESAGTSRLIKGYYSNAAVAKLLEIYDKNQENIKKAQDEFLKWFKSAAASAAMLAAPVAGAALPWITLSSKALPLVADGIIAIKKMSDAVPDDYVGLNTIHFFYRLENKTIRFRWIVNDGIETWSSTETDIIHIALPYQSGDNKLKLEASASFKVIP